MTIDQMKKKKIELGYTNEQVADLSGVPLGTVQKIFAGETKAPRYDTIMKLMKVLGSNHEAAEYSLGHYGEKRGNNMAVSESASVYIAGSRNTHNAGKMKVTAEGKDRQILAPEIKLGMFDGKYKIPPDDMFYDDEIVDMFEDI